MLFQLYVVLSVCSGVTQELIDETRSSTENQMLADLQELAAEGGCLESRGDSGETVVCSGLIITVSVITWS